MRTREFVARQLACVQESPEGGEGRSEAIERLTKELASFPVEEPHHDRRDPCKSCREDLDQVRAQLDSVIAERDAHLETIMGLNDQLAALQAKPAAAKKPTVAKVKRRR